MFRVTMHAGSTVTPMAGRCVASRSSHMRTALLHSSIESTARPTGSPVAAKCVAFFEPFKTAFTALDQTTTFPWMSVFVMIELLKVALMWAMTSASMNFRTRLVLVAFVFTS